MKQKPWMIGLFEAAGVVAYIISFALAVGKLQVFAENFSPSPAASMTLFLLAFSSSALICGLIVFGYPYILFMEGKKREAVAVVLWGAASLAVLSAACAGLLFFL
jgi:hypothetical protein